MTILAASKSIPVVGGTPKVITAAWNSNYNGMFISAYIARNNIPPSGAKLELIASTDGGNTYSVIDSIDTTNFVLPGSPLIAKASVGHGWPLGQEPTNIGIRISSAESFTPDMSFKAD